MFSSCSRLHLVQIIKSRKAVNPIDVVSLQAVVQLDLPRILWIGEQSSYAELSEACNINETDLRRLLRHAMSNHVFEELDGLAPHTAASRPLAENEALGNMVGMLTHEMFPSATRVCCSSLEATTCANCHTGNACSPPV